MTLKTANHLTPRQRLGRGLAYTAVGPVDVTRGALGVSAQALCGAVCALRRRYQSGQLRQDLAAAQEVVERELAAAQEVVAGLPQAIQEARAPRRRRRALLVGATAVAVLGIGAVAFSVIRRSRQPKPSTLPPSVQHDPKP
ncbi:MAG: cell wall synthesis protein CwsA [Mycobacterium sp.]